MSDTVYVGLGSNEGDRETHLVAALTALSRIDAVAVLGCSSLFDSAPVGPPQPRFLNAVVALECGLPPQRLLCILQQIEKDLGRRREERWGPAKSSCPEYRARSARTRQRHHEPGWHPAHGPHPAP
ncbi:2-amino-4-hydroxy-6-hydroxymethyldihydropteridine diphosphokinase, partial [Pyxidicoccus sp. 3LFB2]